MNIIPVKLGFAWMLTVIILSSAPLGETSTIESLRNLLDRYNNYSLIALLSSTFYDRSDNAEVQYEKLQFHGTIINLSGKDIAGTAYLSWGKWMPDKSPKFPIYTKDIMTFASQGVCSHQDSIITHVLSYFF